MGGNSGEGNRQGEWLVPYAPPRCCKVSGCSNTTTHPSRYCEAHRKEAQQKQDRQRGTAAKRGYTSKWQRYSRRFLKENRYCVNCLDNGRTIYAEEVDHIEPHKGDKQLFWASDNHQSLCKSCHSSKTAKETFHSTP